MSNTFANSDLLEIVEHFAEENDLISSEEQLSERFDEEVAPNVIEAYGENDEPAMNEAFSGFVDYLQEEGQLHSEQVNSYVYVGKYS